MNRFLLSVLSALMLLSCAAAGTSQAAPPSPLNITTSTLANGNVGTTYSQTLTASGGKKPYTWSITTGTLPAGLSLNAGVISGTPTAAGGNNFTVQVKDANNTTATKPLSITAYTAPAITIGALSDGYTSTAYGQTLDATGGKTPYTWSIITGTLPSGLTLNAGTGAISGTPSAAGISTFTAQVKDANNSTTAKTFSITVNAALSVTTQVLHDPYVGIAYSEVLTATGGKTPYTWSINSGTLPTSVSLNASTGAISGIPSAVGISTFTVQVNDANNITATKALTITVTNLGAITGIVADQATGAPLPGTNVTLALADIKSKFPGDRVYTCNGSPIAASDYPTVAANDNVKLGCTGHGDWNKMQFKIRNPFGADPFMIRWNGISASVTPEYVAQSFRPTRSGNLTKVSFYLPYGWPCGQSGSLWVQLKPALGGDFTPPLAQSGLGGYINEVCSTATWVEFSFPTPVAVTVGQEYYLQVRGGMWWGVGNYGGVLWAFGSTYADGRAYQRTNGAWGQLPAPLYFRTYIDTTIDLAFQPPRRGTPSVAEMNGDTAQMINMGLYNYTIGYWEKCGSADPATGWGGYWYSGDDLTVDWTVTAGLDRYYDPNGWLTVLLDNLNPNNYPPPNNMITDQFGITFNRTLTAVTDSNGIYSFASLPDGNYTLTFEKSGYNSTTTTSGSLLPGQAINVGTTGLARAFTPGTVAGTITDFHTDAQVSGAVISITDSLGVNHGATTDAAGSYAIPGMPPGSFTGTVSKVGYDTGSISGSVSSNQVTSINISLVESKGDVVGVVTDAATALTVASASVSVTDAANVSHTSTTNTSGAYSITNVSPGAFSGTVTKSGYVSGSISGAVLPGQTTTVNVSLTPYVTNGSIRGTVTDASTGSPISSASVAVTDSASGVHSASTLNDGTYTIADIPPGVFNGTINKGGYASAILSGTAVSGQATVADAALTPVLPVIGNIQVNNVTSSTANILWSTDQPTDGRVDYGFTITYDNNAYSALQTTAHSMFLSNLTPGRTYHFRITSTNGYGFSSSSIDNTFNTVGPITIVITAPLDNSTVNARFLTVEGTVVNVTGNETGVVVNGVLGTVYGNQFRANHVPVAVGSNTITATATDTAGYTSTTSATVGALIPPRFITLNSSIQSSVVPFDVTLSFGGTIYFMESDIGETGPAAVEWIQSGVDGGIVRITVPGIYTFTGTITGVDGFSYQDTVTVVAYDLAYIDALLRAKWDGMTGRLAFFDTVNALKYIHPDTKPVYEAMFSDLAEQLPAVMATQTQFQFVAFHDDHAEFKLVTFEGGVPYSYEVTYRKDSTGIWRILEY